MDFGYSSRQGVIKSGRFDPIPSLQWSRKTRETESNIRRYKMKGFCHSYQGFFNNHKRERDMKRKL